jgi:hypothetical protein
LMFSDISRYFFGHFWQYKPPGGLPETNPGFLETQISAKSQGLKTSWSIFCWKNKVCGAKFQFSGTNFPMRFQIKWSRNWLLGEVRRSLTFLGPPPILRK